MKKWTRLPLSVGVGETKVIAKSKQLMRALDEVNAHMGAGALTFAAADIQRPWKTKFNRRSPRYTTMWEELREVGKV